MSSHVEATFESGIPVLNITTENCPLFQPSLSALSKDETRFMDSEKSPPIKDGFEHAEVLDLTQDTSDSQSIDLECKENIDSPSNENQPLDLTTEKVTRKSSSYFPDINNNDKALGADVTDLTSTTFQDFGSTFAKAISNLFEAEFPQGLHATNFQNYSAFLTAASAIYPYALRYWVFSVCKSQGLKHPPPPYKHSSRPSSSFKEFKEMIHSVGPQQPFQTTGESN